MSMLAPPAPDAPAVDLPAPTAWTWRITWQGKSWTDRDLTGQHLGVLTVLAGDDEWEALDVPSKLAAARSGVLDGYMRLVNMLVAFVAIDRTPEWMPQEKAQEVMAETVKEIASSSVDDILGAIAVQSS